MAKKQEEKKGKQTMVSEAVKELGKEESTTANVLEWLKAKYPKEEFPSIQGQTATARKRLGWTRGGSPAAPTGDAPAGSEFQSVKVKIAKARELCEELKLSPARLLEILQRIHSLQDLRLAVEFLDDMQGK